MSTSFYFILKGYCDVYRIYVIRHLRRYFVDLTIMLIALLILLGIQCPLYFFCFVTIIKHVLTHVVNYKAKFQVVWM